MERFTISVPKEFKKKLDRHPDINWPAVMREGIKKRLGILERLRGKGEL